MLQFDYEEAHAQKVTGLLGFSDQLVGWEAIAIVLTDLALVVRVDADTDELAVNLETAPSAVGGWRRLTELQDAVGSELGWCWIGRNYLGYLDMFTLSFSGVVPQVCFVGEASCVRIMRIVQA